MNPGSSGSKGVALTNWMVQKAAGLLERTSSRRGFILGSAMVGSAVAVAGCTPAVSPGSPYNHITDCAGGLCTDGYTEFCCTINDGFNTCPPGSFAGGWWRADYSSFCNGTRYYIDCMQNCCGPDLGNGFCAGCSECRCGGDCNSRRVYCNYFRYGQCHQEISISGPIACRVVTCSPPYNDVSLACSTTLAVDNSTAEHGPARPCTPAPPPSSASAATAASLSPGRIAVFTRFTNTFIYTRQSNGGAWGGGSWNSLSPAVTSGLSSASDATGLYVVGRGDDTMVRYNRLTNGVWAGEAILPGVLAISDPKVVADSSGVHVFVRTVDQSIVYGRIVNGSWTGWSSLGGKFNSNLAAVATASGVFVFARSADSTLSVNRRVGSSWSGWQSLGGAVISDPTAVAFVNTVFVFAQQTGNQTWYRAWAGGPWAGWASLAGNVVSDPVATVGPDGVYVFVRGSDQSGWVNRLKNGAWTGFAPLGGRFDTNIDAVGDSTGVYAFARGPEGGLWTGRHANGSWSGWSSLGGTVAPIDASG